MVYISIWLADSATARDSNDLLGMYSIGALHKFKHLPLRFKGIWSRSMQRSATNSVATEERQRLLSKFDQHFMRCVAFQIALENADTNVYYFDFLNFF